MGRRWGGGATRLLVVLGGFVWLATLVRSTHATSEEAPVVHENDLAGGNSPSPVEEEEDPACIKRFTREYRPTCGSDGTIYSNPSVFRYHQCLHERRGLVLTEVVLPHCHSDDL